MTPLCRAFPMRFGEWSFSLIMKNLNKVNQGWLAKDLF
jgi:hypothetical protein